MTERCPSPGDLERTYWNARADRSERDLEAEAHARSCETCRSTWHEIDQLAAVGRTIQPAAWQRREELRTTLLSKMEHAVVPARASARPRRWLAPLAVAAAAIAIWLAWPRSSVGPAPRSEPRGLVLEHAGARALVVAGPPDEIVRLVAGTITVTVPTLSEGRRLRVITGDDAIEVTAAAAFDVTAAGDRLVAMRVLHGQAKLLAAGQSTTVRAGETWRTQLADRSQPPPVPPVQPPAARSAPPTPPSVALHAKPRQVPPETKPTEAKPTPTTIAPVEPPVAVAPSETTATPVAPPSSRSMAQQAFDEGWTALRGGDYRAAASSFERALAVTTDPQVIEDATFWRAVALARGGEVTTAVHVLTAFVRAYPSSARIGEARVMLGWMLFERGDRREAQAHFQAASGDTSARVRESARKGLAEVAKRSY